MTDNDTSQNKHNDTPLPIDTMSSVGNIHVVRRDDGWVVLGEGGSKEIARVSNQREAIERARDVAVNQSSDILIHNRHGKLAGREVYRDQDWELEILENPESLQKSPYIDSTYFADRPHIRGRRVLVSMIAANAEDNKLSVAELASEFTLSEEQVLAALLYYREHKEEIDRQDAEEQTAFDEMYERHGKQQGE